MADRIEIIVSDVHLGAVPETTERAFRRFLRWAGDTADAVLIPGDLFDFWFEYRSVFPAAHFRVLAQLADLVDSGVTVRFIGGNHDAWAGEMLNDHVGIEVLPDPSEMRVAGHSALVAHGDGVGRGDLGYRIFRKLIRSGIAESAFRLLHPDVGSRVAGRASSTKARLQEPHDPARSRSDHIEAWAVDTLRTRSDLQLVVAGHAHEPRLREVADGRWYVNAGDWLTHFSFALVRQEGPPELWRWQNDSPAQIRTDSNRTSPCQS